MNSFIHILGTALGYIIGYGTLILMILSILAMIKMAMDSNPNDPTF